MKRKRYTEEQIVRILKEVEEGKPIASSCREYGVSEQTMYRWRTKYSGMDIAEVRRMKELEEDNLRLRRIVAQQAMDIDLLKEVNAKKW